jgi:hypothetical protein
MLNFPTNPSLNQTYSPTETTWRWDGSSWGVIQPGITISGDATGTNVGDSLPISLVSTGVSAGTYTKVSVDIKGRIVLGTQLSGSDVTTALGYTPVNTAGDTMTGNLSLSASPTDPLHVVNKAYIDSKIWLAIAVGY